jgi:hypothetical protein
MDYFNQSKELILQGEAGAADSPRDKKGDRRG